MTFLERLVASRLDYTDHYSVGEFVAQEEYS